MPLGKVRNMILQNQEAVFIYQWIISAHFQTWEFIKSKKMRKDRIEKKSIKWWSKKEVNFNRLFMKRYFKTNPLSNLMYNLLEKRNYLNKWIKSIVRRLLNRPRFILRKDSNLKIKSIRRKKNKNAKTLWI